jgi:hypothetical protein
MRTSNYLVAALCLLAMTVNAHASLVPYQSDGVNLVYSSETNVTWTQDGNILGDMISAEGVNAVFNAIDAVTPTISLDYTSSGQSTYTLTESDFNGFWGDDGRTTWYGAYAFINYLNSISYAGTNQWTLPNAVNSVFENPAQVGYTRAGDMGQLYYDEVGASAGSGFYSGNSQLTGEFSNVQSGQYWAEYLPGNGTIDPFDFDMAN